MDAPILYHYHSQTGEFLQQSVAKRDNFDMLWIIPAFATEIVVLDEKAGFARIFNEQTQEWSYAEDHKGEIFYLKTTGERVEIKEFGAIASNLTDKPKPDFEATFDEKLNEWVLPELILREREQTRLLARAEQRIIDLTEATDTEIFDDDEIDPDDVALLKKWKRYRVFIKKVDLTAEPVVWPELPESE